MKPSEQIDSPLTGKERDRLAQLEKIVDHGITTFRRVGSALVEIRNSRLYRDRFPTFEAYLKERYCLALSTATQIIASTQTAELLEQNGTQLPEGVSEAAIRPLNALGDEALQKASWELVIATCPDRVPTQPVVSKIVRIIRNAVEPVNGNGHDDSYPSRERPFVQAAQRLSTYDGFDHVSRCSRRQTTKCLAYSYSMR